MNRRLHLKLHPAQFDFYFDPRYTSLFVGGVGSGKTWVGARKALHKALRTPRTLGLIAANTHTQLNQSTLVEFWDALAEVGMIEGRDYVVNHRPPATWKISSRFTRHAGVITLRNGAQVVTRSLFNWRPVLGLTLGWAWIDEARDTSVEAFRAVLSRLRCKKARRPQMFITTTPNGFDWMYEYFEADPTRRPELYRKRRVHTAATVDNAPNLPAEYIEVLRESFDARLSRQELEGRFIDVFTGQAYYAFDRKKNVGDAVFDPKLPVYLCCDFNATPMSWIIAQKVRGQGEVFQDEVLMVVDEIVMDASNTREAADEFRERGYDPERTIVFGDAAGHHNTTVSDYALMEQLGFRDIRVPKANPTVLDRVASVNGKLCNTNGKTGVVISPRCTRLIEDLVQVGFKPGTRRLDKSNGKLTHASDALGYCIHRLWPLQRGVRKTVRSTGY